MILFASVLVMVVLPLLYDFNDRPTYREKYSKAETDIGDRPTEGPSTVMETLTHQKTAQSHSNEHTDKEDNSLNNYSGCLLFHFSIL